MQTTPVTLLERLRQPNNEAAWRRFVHLYTPLLHYWARRTGLLDQEADDLVQEVFAHLVRELPRFAYDSQRTFRGWLHTVALNKWNERRRRGQALLQPINNVDVADPMAAEPGSLLASDEFKAMLYRRALDIMRADFPGKTWQACIAVVAEGKTAQQVAEDLGMTVGAVHAARFRVLARLRQELAGLAE